MALAGGNQAEEDRGGAAAVVAPGEEPILPAHCDPPQRVLGGVVVDGQFAVGGVHAQGFPLVQRVRDGLAHGALGQDGSAAGGLL